jgi:phosphate starvation-inducible PhoH-like protein
MQIIKCSYNPIVPKNDKQKYYIENLRKQNPNIVVASGTAGSGKTLLATNIGAEKLINGEYTKIVLTRPTVPVGDDIGFLPGTLAQKMEPWIRPLHDSLSSVYSTSKIEKMMDENIIEIVPLTYMRGRTFNNAWIICDEAQNTTIDQMLMVLTRIGENSKMIITGDPQQHDRFFDTNGLIDLIQKLNLIENNYFKVIEFDENDVQRHPAIPSIVNMYK